MATDVLMPQLGESIAEGTIVRWMKRVGDAVERDEPLFEISTDKVDAEIPSPTAGVLTEIRVAEGETVPVDSIVARIGEAADVGRPAADDDAPAQPDRSPPTTHAPAVASGDRRRAGRFSPVVRRLAREHDIDVSAIEGTGARGRVTKDDVLRVVEARRSEGAVADAPSVDRVESMSVMRRRIAEHMVASRRTSAHVHTVFDVDFSRVAKLRDAHRDAFERAGAKLTYLTFVARAVVDALVEVPVVNASVEGHDIIYRRDVNLGFAVALDDGLIVPVVTCAQDRTMHELARAIRDVSARARAKQLSPDEVGGGTFTITNPGVFGSILGLPIINQPQVAILCVGAVERRPVVVGEGIGIRTRAYLTLGFDHRIIDGAVADRFMARVKETIEQFDDGLLR